MNEIVLWRFFHFVAAALWLGGAWSLGGEAKQALQRADSGGEILLPRIGKNVKFTLLGILVSLATGLGLIFAKGGFGAFKGREMFVHGPIGLVVVALVVHLLVVMPAWKQVREGTEAGGAEAQQALSAAKRMAMGAGIGQLMWTLALFLMIFSVYRTIS